MESSLNGGIAHSAVSTQASEKTETWMTDSMQKLAQLIELVT